MNNLYLTVTIREPERDLKGKSRRVSSALSRLRFDGGSSADFDVIMTSTGCPVRCLKKIHSRPSSGLFQYPVLIVLLFLAFQISPGQANTQQIKKEKKKKRQGKKKPRKTKQKGESPHQSRRCSRLSRAQVLGSGSDPPRGSKQQSPLFLRTAVRGSRYLITEINEHHNLFLTYK